MSRKMDRHIDQLREYNKAVKRASEVGKLKREADAHKSKLEAQLIKTMGKSKVGTINGVTAIEVYESTPRRSIRIETAEQVCPKLLDKLVTTTSSTKVKVLDV